jgi:hypothetical protein
MTTDPSVAPTHDEASAGPRAKKPTSRGKVIVAAAAVAVLAACTPWLLERFGSKPIRLSRTESPPIPGWQLVKDPVWVKAEANGPLPTEGRWQDQFVCMVFRSGEPYYQRMIDSQQIESGRPFDLALEKTGADYTVAFVVVENGQPGRRLSNTISFTH